MSELSKTERGVFFKTSGVVCIASDGTLYCNDMNVMLEVDEAVRSLGPVTDCYSKYAATVRVEIELLGDLGTDGDAGE